MRRLREPHAAADDIQPLGGSHLIVAWSRRNRYEAQLLYGPNDFGEADWPSGTRRAVEQQRRDADAALRSVAGALGGGSETLERVVPAAVDIPCATLRRRLRAGDALPRRAEALVERAGAARLIAHTGRAGCGSLPP